jgi:hypothetical protein
VATTKCMHNCMFVFHTPSPDEYFPLEHNEQLEDEVDPIKAQTISGQNNDWIKKEKKYKDECVIESSLHLF